MRTGFTCGVFDLFHAGHVLMLQECKQHCDYLIVALNRGLQFSEKINPGKREPVYSIKERKLIMESCGFVDEVVIYDSEKQLMEILQDRDINIRFLGDDYIGKPITGMDSSIEIYYIKRDHGFSTTEVIRKVLEKNK